MKTSTKTRSQAARAFVSEWLGRGYEKGETQRFWLSLLHNVFGIDDPTKMMEFEIPVKTITKEKGADFIDAYIFGAKVLIEQKNSHTDLSSKLRQSDGMELTPYQQARRYASGLPVSMAPRWIVACNFTTFEVHDMERPDDAPEIIHLANLEKEWHRLGFLADDGNAHLKRELEVSIQAGEIVGVLYDKILSQYLNPSDPETQKSLNKLCVRLVFCLYAEDAGIFGAKDMFHDYMSRFPATEFRGKLMELFRVLNTKPEDRDPYMDDRLAAFPYVNGGLFAGDIEIPRINEDIRALILQRASDDFDWSQISPTIFGAVFESTLNPETRRSGGMHYTSLENIHKVIDPLFLDSLKEELAEIKAVQVAKARREQAHAFQDKIAGLKFLDPACGSGNFLTETYVSLRKLENEAIRLIYDGNRVMGKLENPIKVSIGQLYGIEINDFAVSVAQTALWIAESQMMAETDAIVGIDLDPLPLKTYTNIREGNALRMNWEEWEEEDTAQVIVAGSTDIYPVSEAPVPILEDSAMRYGRVDLYSRNISVHPDGKSPRIHQVKFNYFMGNPPFVGQSMRSQMQTEDLRAAFSPCGNYGKMDYVLGWFKKAADLMKESSAQTAFVASNSICQGEMVNLFWHPLLKDGIVINFAYDTFPWKSEAKHNAAVMCVIVGFSRKSWPQKKLFMGGRAETAAHINAYLKAAPDVYISNRSKSINGNVARVVQGSPPADNGRLLLDKSEKDELTTRFPELEDVIRPILRGRDIKRYGYDWANLWLIATFPSRHYDIEQYTAVKNYLLSFGMKRLEQTGKTYTINGEKVHARKKTNNKWFETQDSISYWEEFSKTKIIWAELSDESKFAMCNDFIPLNTVFFLTGAHLHHILGLLNSKLVHWYFSACLGTSSGVGTNRWLKYTIEQLPLAPFTDDSLSALVANRLSNTETTNIEEEIDAIVCRRYGLSAAEEEFILDSC